jgi:hypothetical protein
MAKIRVFKRNSKFIDPADLVEEISILDLAEVSKNIIIHHLKKKLKAWLSALIFYKS